MTNAAPKLSALETQCVTAFAGTYNQDNYELGRQFAARNPRIELFNDRGAIVQPVRRLFARQWGEGGMVW